MPKKHNGLASLIIGKLSDFTVIKDIELKILCSGSRLAMGLWASLKPEPSVLLPVYKERALEQSP